MTTLVSQGAEGRLFETTFLGRPCLMKERFKKSYRHPVLDEKLTNKRLNQEVGYLERFFFKFSVICSGSVAGVITLLLLLHLLATKMAPVFRTRLNFTTSYFLHLYTPLISIFQCRMLSKCRSLGIRTPTVYYVNNKTNTIYMEYMKQTAVLKDFIDDHV